MPAITVLRGFKVSVSTLDAFLDANHCSETYGHPPYYPDHPDLVTSELLFSKMGESGDKNNYRVIIPQREGYNHADTAYITYSWFMVHSQRELRDDDLPAEAPPAFDSLRKEVLSFSKTPNDQTNGQMGTYIVFTQEGHYLPEYMQQRNLIVGTDTATDLLHPPPPQPIIDFGCRRKSNVTSAMKSGSTHRTHGKDGRYTM